MTPDWRDFTGDPAQDIATIIARYCYLECLVHPVVQYKSESKKRAYQSKAQIVMELILKN